MSTLHFSKYSLNAYADTPYFQAHLPDGYPLSRVLQASRAFRRLPANLKELAEKSKVWADRHGRVPEGINEWYDASGNELDPDTGKPLTDAEINSGWPPDPQRASFLTKDIQVPPGGFPDPNIWEPQVQQDTGEEDEYRPTLDQLINDLMSRGTKRTAQTYGLPVPPDDGDLNETPSQFDERKRHALASVYFKDQDEERSQLTEGLRLAEIYNDLSGWPKELFDRAELITSYVEHNEHTPPPPPPTATQKSVWSASRTPTGGVQLRRKK